MIEYTPLTPIQIPIRIIQITIQNTLVTLKHKALFFTTIFILVPTITSWAQYNC